MNMTVIMVIGLIVVLAIIVFLMRGRKTPPAQTPPVRKPSVTHQPNTPVPSDAKPTSPASAATTAAAASTMAASSMDTAPAELEPKPEPSLALNEEPAQDNPSFDDLESELVLDDTTSSTEAPTLDDDGALEFDMSEFDTDDTTQANPVESNTTHDDATFDLEADDLDADITSSQDDGLSLDDEFSFDTPDLPNEAPPQADTVDLETDIEDNTLSFADTPDITDSPVSDIQSTDADLETGTLDLSDEFADISIDDPIEADTDNLDNTADLTVEGLDTDELNVTDLADTQSNTDSIEDLDLNWDDTTDTANTTDEIEAIVLDDVSADIAQADITTPTESEPELVVDELEETAVIEEPVIEDTAIEEPTVQDDGTQESVSELDDTYAQLDAITEEEIAEEQVAQTEGVSVDTPVVDDSEFMQAFNFVQDLDGEQVTLDLAEQYLELGEYDSAKRLINEVLASGNEAHKAKAESLLEGMS